MYAKIITQIGIVAKQIFGLRSKNELIFQDVRVPCTPVARLNNHRACVNGIAWAPHSSCHICTAGKLWKARAYLVSICQPDAILINGCNLGPVLRKLEPRLIFHRCSEPLFSSKYYICLFVPELSGMPKQLEKSAGSCYLSDTSSAKVFQIETEASASLKN